MEKPLRKTAMSVALAGRAIRARVTTQKSAMAFAAIREAFSVASNACRIIFFESNFDRSQAYADRRSANFVGLRSCNRFAVQHELNCGRNAAFGVGAGQRPASAAQFFGCIPHDKRMA